MSDAAPLLSPRPPAANTNHARQKPDNKGKYNLAPSRIRFPASSSSALYDPERGDLEAEGDDPDLYDLRTSGYRPTPVRDRSAVDVSAADRRETRPGLPKLSRECLWSEFKCYGSYIFPVVFVFGVLAIGICLGVFGWKKGWFDK